MSMYWFVLIFFKNINAIHCLKIHRDLMKSPNAKLLPTHGNDAWHSHTEDWRPWITFKKIKTTVFFQINCISLPHQPLQWAAQIDQFKCDLLSSPPSTLSQLLRSSERKCVWGWRMCYMCGEHEALPKLTLSSLCICHFRQPSVGQGDEWPHPISQIRKLRQNQEFI